jgi:hypothetical protein
MGKCCVELTMYEDIAAQVENSFVQRETLATAEGCCICGSQGKLEAVDSPTRMWRGKLDADSRDTLNITYFTQKWTTSTCFGVTVRRAPTKKETKLERIFNCCVH